MGQQEKQHMHFPSTYIASALPFRPALWEGERGKRFVQKLNATIESQNRVKECKGRERETEEEGKVI